MSLQSEVDAWSSSPSGQKGVVRVTGVDESSRTLQLSVAGRGGVSLTVPESSDCVFELELPSAHAVDLGEWNAILASFAFETEELTLARMLDKCVAVAEKLKLQGDASSSSSSSIAPAAAASAAPARSSRDRAGSSSAMDVDSDSGFGAGGSEDEPMGSDADGGDGSATAASQCPAVALLNLPLTRLPLLCSCSLAEMG